MFSTEAINNESFPVCIITKAKAKGKSTAKEVIYYTEPTRAAPSQSKSFLNQIEDYIDKSSKEGFYKLDKKYKFEMVPSIATKGITQPRFINYYLASSNSGKSYQISQIVRRYLQMFPDNLVAYASANSLDNDASYADIKDKIQEIDVFSLESTIDFSDERYRNSLFIFDDCDSGFSGEMEDVDARLTPEAREKMTIGEKQKALKMLKAKCEVASEWIYKSIQSFMMNGRKMNESLCIVGHKPNEGRFENKIIGESTGVILFPGSCNRKILQDFAVNKLGLTKEESKWLFNSLPWYQYDFLYISTRTSKPFAIGMDFIKVFGDLEC